MEVQKRTILHNYNIYIPSSRSAYFPTPTIIEIRAYTLINSSRELIGWGCRQLWYSKRIGGGGFWRVAYRTAYS